MKTVKFLLLSAVIGLSVACEKEDPNATVTCFTYTPESGISAGTEIVFENCSENAERYLWDFGDGSDLSKLENPKHTYNEAGTYSVSLAAQKESIIDNNGDGIVNTDDTYISSNKITQEITVN